MPKHGAPDPEPEPEPEARRLTFSETLDSRSRPASPGSHGVTGDFLSASADNSGSPVPPESPVPPHKLSQLRMSAGAHSVASIESSRAAAGQLCTFVPARHWSRDVTIFILGIVDAGYVALTLLNMWELMAQENTLAPSLLATGVMFRIQACWVVYWIKVFSHLGLVCFKMIRIIWCSAKMQKYP